MKTYQGIRKPDGSVEVTVKDDAGNVRPLAPRHDLRNHSPAGFEWGYGGSGPSQLALAICADALGDDARAQGVYQHFKWQNVARFPESDWMLTDIQVLNEVRVLEGEHP